MNFHLLGSDGMTHIDGHKHPQADNPIIKYTPKKVYFQTVDPRNQQLNELVEVGTEVKIGTKLGIRPDFGVPVYSSVNGKVVGIEKITSSVIGRPVDHLVIEVDPTKNDEVLLQPLSSNPTKEEVVNKIKEGGIVGLGGAGFPTFIKYNTKPDVKIDTLLVNAVECEPYLTTDYLEGSRSINDAMYSLNILLKSCNIDKAIIAIKYGKKALIDAVTNAIKENGNTNIELKLVPDQYPMGFERTLIKQTLKRTYEILPSECHVIVNNLQTIEAIGRLFRDGKIISNRVITISGDAVSFQNNVECPVGTLVGDLIVDNGGYSIEEVKLINGGPMCGRPLMTDKVPTLLQSGGYTVVERYDVKPEPCWKCGKCVDHCPMGLQPVQIQMALKQNNIERAHDLQVEKCVECGLCSFVCPSHIDVTGNMAKAKTLARFKFKPGTLSEIEKRKESLKALLNKLCKKGKKDKSNKNLNNPKPEAINEDKKGEKK